jgi:hypothetical protein
MVVELIDEFGSAVKVVKKLNKEEKKDKEALEAILKTEAEKREIVEVKEVKVEIVEGFMYDEDGNFKFTSLQVENNTVTLRVSRGS